MGESILIVGEKRSARATSSARCNRSATDPGLSERDGYVGAEIDGVDAPSRHRCAKVVSSIIT